jgi:hypothetical protein
MTDPRNDPDYSPFYRETTSEREVEFQCLLRDSQNEIDRLRVLVNDLWGATYNLLQLAERLGQGLKPADPAVVTARTILDNASLVYPRSGVSGDYSPAYQDEYQRLWHEAAAERDRLRSQLAVLQKAWIERGGEGIDRLWSQLQKVKAERDQFKRYHDEIREEYMEAEAERDRLLAVAEAARRFAEFVAMSRPQLLESSVAACLRAALAALKEEK